MYNKHIFLRNGRFIIILLFILFALTTFTVSAAPEAQVETGIANVQHFEASNAFENNKDQLLFATDNVTSWISSADQGIFSHSIPHPKGHGPHPKGNGGSVMGFGYGWSD